MIRTLFISDLHFGHENVIEYDNRPYTTVDEMDKDLIKRWNKAVRKNDIVWFLGDLTLSTNRDYISSIVGRLNGKKRMVLGNHDKRSVEFYRSVGFEFVTKYPVILHQFFVLSHEPIEGIQDGGVFFNIYGHVHNDSRFNTVTPNSRCISACRINYTPSQVPEYDKFVNDRAKDMSDRVFNYNKR